MDLLKIESPAFIKVLSVKELENLAQDVRDFMIDTLTKTGGQLASNLSSVELSIALHKVFNSPTDKILFDAGHQAYTHKILTGRAKDFRLLGQTQGLSGYQSKNESIHDPFDATYIGQALSIGYGLSMKNDADHIVVVLTNESIQNGQIYEALNHISISKKKIIIVINDNESSESLSGVSTSLKNLMVAKPITRFKDDMSEFFNKGNVITGPIKRGLKNITTNLSKTVTTTNLFTELGFKYAGPFDGHSVRDVIRVLNFARSSSDAVVVHFKTSKGKGYQEAYNDKDGLWVKLNKFDIETGTHKVDYPKGLGHSETILNLYTQELKNRNKEIVIVNTLKHLKDKLKGERIYHVETGSHHPISFSSGLSLAGFKPIIYADARLITSRVTPIINEVSNMNLDMTVLDFNAGLNSLEGGVQTSLFEYPILSAVPNLVIAQGKDSHESAQLLELSIKHKGPFVLRVYDQVARTLNEIFEPNFEVGQWELLKAKAEVPKAVLFMVGPSIDVIGSKIDSNELDYWVVNCRFINLIDESLLYYLKQYDVPYFIITQEYEAGSLAQNITKFMKNNDFKQTLDILGYPKQFFGFGSQSTIRKETQLDTYSILNHVINALGENQD